MELILLCMLMALKFGGEIIYSRVHFALQNDIDNIYNWSVKNKMNFYPSKCTALTVTKQYYILDNLPCTVFQYKLNAIFTDLVLQSMLNLIGYMSHIPLTE